MKTTRRHFALAASALGISAAFGSVPARAADAEDAEALVVAAQATVEAFTRDNDITGFVAALGPAKGILVFPRVIKAGLVFGGSGGSGVLLVRNKTRNDWYGPAFYTMGSASVGLQIGASAAEVVILAMTDNALNALYDKADLSLGGDASVAIWNKGVGAAADTEPDFLAYSRVKGAFAGFSIHGSVVAARQTLNDAYYGKRATPLAILLEREVSNPAAANLQAAVKGLRRIAISEIAQ